MSHQGKCLRSGEKSIVMNVRAFFEKEKAQGKSIMRERVIDRTASATGIGKTTIKRISKEFRSEGEFETPTKRYKRSRVRINLDDFSTDIIRREIHAAYTRKEYPTLDSLQKKLLNYLRSLCKNRNDKRPVVFLDETWLNSHAAPERI